MTVNLRFEKSFVKDLKGVKDKSVLKRIKSVIEELESLDNLSAFRGDIRKLKGSDRFWRIRIGDYRIGLEVEGNTVIFVRILHRKEIYRYFP